MCANFRKKTTEKRIKVCYNLDKKMLKKMEALSITLDYPQSRMVDEGIHYVLKKHIIPNTDMTEKDKITLSLNFYLWSDLQRYAKQKGFKLTHLLEAAIRHSLKKYGRKSNEFLRADLILAQTKVSDKNGGST